jgi:hypothetical protein
MAYEERLRTLPAGAQGPDPEVFRQMLGTMVQQAIRAEFERFLGAAPYRRCLTESGDSVPACPARLRRDRLR